MRQRCCSHDKGYGYGSGYLKRANPSLTTSPLPHPPDHLVVPRKRRKKRKKMSCGGDGRVEILENILLAVVVVGVVVVAMVAVIEAL